MTGIGATAPRLHGFHRFLPRLWELFFWPCFPADLATVLLLGPKICPPADRSSVPPQRGECLESIAWRSTP
jgi:hypothetical protein